MEKTEDREKEKKRQERDKKKINAATPRRISTRRRDSRDTDCHLSHKHSLCLCVCSVEDYVIEADLSS